MRKEKAIVRKFKIWQDREKRIQRLKAKLTRFGYTEEQITGFENQANGQ